MGWAPATFWAATPHETYAALDAFNRFHGGEDDGEDEDGFAEFRRGLEHAGLA